MAPSVMEWVLGRMGRARPGSGRFPAASRFIYTLGPDIGLRMAPVAALLSSFYHHIC